MAIAHKKDSFKGIGVVEVRPFKLENEEKVYDTNAFTKHNLIVAAGRGTLIDLLLGISKKKLAFIRWGKGGAPTYPDGDPLIPFEVSDQDVNVGIFLLDKPLNYYNRISNTVCSFTETVICDEVDSDVNEAAMMFEDTQTLERSIFARITFPTARLTVEKGSGLEVEWTFSFNSVEE